MAMTIVLAPGYTCRGCGHVSTYKDRFIKCPVCGIKWS